MHDLHFAQPLWLLAGLILAAGLVVACRFFERRNRRDLQRFVDGKVLVRLLAGVSPPLRWAKRVFLILGVLCLSTALARPQLGHEWREVKRRGIDILFALDASRSMLAQDVTPSRLERAKLGMIDFVEKLDGDRVGLLPFSGSAFLLCPLTLDYDAFRQSLDAVDADLLPRMGTDLASAIREASRAFEEAGNNHRILVLITDGEDLQGEALAAAKAAAKDGMVIHTVGIGSPEGALIPVRTPQGATQHLRDEAGDVVRSKLDEASLRALAEATGGTYAPFGQHAEGLRRIYQEKLSLVPREDLSQRLQQVPIERFQWPLAAGILFLLLEFVMGDRRRERQSAKAGALTRLPASVRGTALALLAATLLGMTTYARASDARHAYNDGVSAYQRGDFDQANTAFQNSIQSTRDLSVQERAYYNLGNTHFQSGAAGLAEGKTAAAIEQWEKSLAAYDGALALNREDEDARFNRDLVQRKLEELKQQQQEQQNKEQQNKDQQNKDQQNKEQQSKEQQGKEPKDGDPKSSGENGTAQPPDSMPKENAPPEDSTPNEESSPSKDPSAQAAQPTPSGKPEQSDETPAGDGESNEPPASAKPESAQPSALNPDQPIGESEPAGADQVAVGDDRHAPGEMSRDEARQLLRALENDEERLLLVPRHTGHPRDPANTTKGKDW